MATIDVTHAPYGAGGKGATDDADAFRRAVAAARSGDTVYVPAGTYLLGRTVEIPSGITLRGDGPTSLLVAIHDNGWNGFPATHPGTRGNSSVVMLSLTGATGVNVEKLGFDINTARNYPQAIHINKGSAHVYVYGCTFTAPAPDAIGNTMMAVSAADSTYLRVIKNTLKGMQLKMAGGSGTRFVLVAENVITNPYQWGISLVGRSRNAVVTNAVIHHNTVTEIAASGGIYFGDDDNGTERFHMTCERITIVGNHLSGTPRATANFIEGIICSTSRDWVLSDNVVTQASGGQNTTGIKIETRYVDGAVGGRTGLVVSGNQITGPTGGIVLSQKTATNPGGADPFIVKGNTLTGTAGIVVNGAGYKNGHVTGNTLNGGEIHTRNAGRVRVSDNTLDPAPAATAPPSVRAENEAPPPTAV
ncbi:MAG TPA: glycosyl hydrolase family 28-related protein [Longimicrobium sp.]